MMTRYIVHESGVIFDASECVLINDENLDDHDMARLSGDDYFDDGVIVEIAERLGFPIPDAVVVDLDEDGEKCDLCGDSKEVEGGLCAACFGAAPVGVWFSRHGVAVDTHDGFTHDGNDWSHCGRVVFSGDLWAECGKCGAVMSWEDGEVVL